VSLREAKEYTKRDFWIMKKFGSLGYFYGKLVSVAEEAGTKALLWHFRYEDGDEEDLYRADWMRLICDPPATREVSGIASHKSQQVHSSAFRVGAVVDAFACDEESNLPLDEWSVA